MFFFQILYQRVNFQIHPEGGESISVSPLTSKALQEVGKDEREGERWMKRSCLCVCVCVERLLFFYTFSVCEIEHSYRKIHKTIMSNSIKCHEENTHEAVIRMKKPSSLLGVLPWCPLPIHLLTLLSPSREPD